MEKIIPKISSSLSKMWIKVLNIENSLFPNLKESFKFINQHQNLDEEHYNQRSMV